MIENFRLCKFHAQDPQTHVVNRPLIPKNVCSILLIAISDPPPPSLLLKQSLTFLGHRIIQLYQKREHFYYNNKIKVA